MFYSSHLKTALSGKQTYAPPTDSTYTTTELKSSLSRGRKWIVSIELQYYVNIRANFKLNLFEHLLIQFERQSIIDIQSLADVNVMDRKQPLNHFQSFEYFIYVII